MRRHPRSRLRLALALGTAAATVMVLSLSASATGAASGGSLSGTVLDGAGHPISGICVQVDGGPGVQTDATGRYELDGLAAGGYRLQYSDCNPSPSYVSQWYLGHTDQADADTVTVVDLVDTPLADVTLDPGVVVRGTVTDDGGTPLEGVNVNLNPNGSGPSGWAQTGVDGTYSTTPVPSGSYRVQFSPADADHATQFWNDQRSWNTATLLALDVTDGPVHDGVDARLASSATVEGTVTGTDGSALEGICVDADIPNGNGWDGIGGTTTAADGTYTLTGLSPGDVRVHFRDCGSGPHLDQWYDGQSDFDHSTAVVLAPDEVRSGIDAALGAGTSVSGTVTDTDGAPIPNVSVSVNPTTNGASGWAQTDAAGRYTTNALPPGGYRVQFQGTAGFAGEYWNDEPSWNTADILTVSPTDGPVHGGVDASLATGASVSGLVTDPDGHPVGDICVTAAIDTAQGVDGVGGATTAPDGTYTISGLPSRDVKVDFRDCNTVGPYVEQWWNDQPDPEHADVVTLAPGATRTGIDARLAAAGAITGTVTDGGGHPLSGICAQATTDSFVGGLAGTDASGHYSIVLAKPGAYRVQFVDCNQPPVYAGQWWNTRSGRGVRRCRHRRPGPGGHRDRRRARPRIRRLDLRSCGHRTRDRRDHLVCHRLPPDPVRARRAGAARRLVHDPRRPFGHVRARVPRLSGRRPDADDRGSRGAGRRLPRGVVARCPARHHRDRQRWAGSDRPGRDARHGRAG